MTKTAEAGHLASHLMEWLEDVKAGHEVLIMRGHTPVARLVPVTHVARRHGRSVGHLLPLAGKWVGECVLRSGDLADEMFARE